jgi:site-specific recombinase XerD
MHFLEKPIKEYLSFLEIERGCSINTIKSYHYDLTLFLRIIEKHHPEVTEINQFNRQHIRTFVVKLHQERSNSPRSIGRRIAAVSSFFTFIQQDGVYPISENPCLGIRRPQFESRLPSFMTKEEAELFLSCIPCCAPLPIRDEAIFRLFLQTGCRLSELLGVRWIDVQKTPPQIRYFGKGSKERWVPLSPTTLQAMENYKNYLNPPPDEKEKVFRTRRGKPLTRWAVYDAFNKCIAGAQLTGRGLTPHKLRHTCLTLLLEAGADIRSLQEIAGHSSIEVTQIYTHVSSKRVQDTMNLHPLS